MNSDFTLAIHSLTLLALKSDRMVTSEAISESAGVHPVRVRKILSLLKKQGLITSREGSGGGFIFKSELEDVNLWEIYKLTCNGVLRPKCPESNEGCMVGANLQNVLVTIFVGAEEHLGEYLKEVTLKDIIQLVKRKQC